MRSDCIAYGGFKRDEAFRRNGPSQSERLMSLVHNFVPAVLLTLVAISLPGCGFTPGLQVEAGPQGVFRETPTGIQEEDKYILIPVDETEMLKLEAANAPKVRDLPPEWVRDDANYRYRLGPADLLQVIVWDHPELSLQGTNPEYNVRGQGYGSMPGVGIGIEVNPQGRIFFPLLGSIQVAGQTVDEAREQIRAGLARTIRDPQVDVRVVGFRSQKVEVTGQVRGPREVPLTDVPMRLLDAIEAAGGTEANKATGLGLYAAAGAGTTLRPDLDDVRVIRGGKQTSISLLDILDRGHAERNILLQDGDIVHVPNLDAKKIYVMGEVKVQGLQSFERGQLTLAAALQTAGGVVQETSEGTRVVVFRRGNPKPLAYYFNLNDPKSLVLSKRFPLQPSDVVYVATADIAKFERVVRSFMPFVGTILSGMSFGM